LGLFWNFGQRNLFLSIFESYSLFDLGVKMKKFKWLIVVIFALILTTVIVLNISAKPKYIMGSDCVEDGSCCKDKTVCTCEK